MKAMKRKGDRILVWNIREKQCDGAFIITALSPPVFCILFFEIKHEGLLVHACIEIVELQILEINYVYLLHYYN